MSEEALYNAKGVEITTKVARFGGVTYQAANIGSVAVYVAKKFNPIAIALFILTLGLGWWTFELSKQYSDSVSMVFAISLACGVAAIAVQLIWPKLVSTFVLKTSSNDVEKLESTDLEHIEAIRHAVEEAFIRRT
jgi:hypothetical protein